MRRRVTGYGGAGMTQDIVAAMTQLPQPVVPVCYRHPKRETYVRCTRCDRPICPECMNEASVGHQCPECVAEGRRTQRPVRTTFGGSLAGAKGYVTIDPDRHQRADDAAVASPRPGGRGMFGGGFGGLLGGPTPLHQWGAVQGQAVYRRHGDGSAVAGSRAASPTASTTAWSPPCSSTMDCCTCC